MSIQPGTHTEKSSRRIYPQHHLEDLSEIYIWVIKRERERHGSLPNSERWAVPHIYSPAQCLFLSRTHSSFWKDLHIAGNHCWAKTSCLLAGMLSKKPGGLLKPTVVPRGRASSGQLSWFQKHLDCKRICVQLWFYKRGNGSAHLFCSVTSNQETAKKFRIILPPWRQPWGPHVRWVNLMYTLPVKVDRCENCLSLLIMY